MQSDNPKIFFLTVRLFRQEDRLLAAWLRRDAIASYVCLYSCKLQFSGEIIHELAVTNLGGYGVSP